jgi:hypothetical protein
MQQDQNDKMAAEICKVFEENWTLFAAGELDASEVAEMKSHLVECQRCNETLAQENALVVLLSNNRTEPDAALLAGCRVGSGRRAWLVEAHGCCVAAGELDFSGAGVERGSAFVDWFFGWDARATTVAAPRDEYCSNGDH